MKRNFIGLVLIALTFTISCDDEKDECDACQSALNHMAGKISANSCNPLFMQNAWDRIRDDCGSRANEGVGYIAENCSFGYNGSLRCTKLASGLSFFDDGERPIRLRYTSPLSNDTLMFIVGRTKDAPTAQTAVVSSNQNTLLQYTGSNDFDSPVYVTVLQLPLMDTLATEKGILRYDRNNNWGKTREVKVTYDTGLQGYTIELVDWE